MYMYIQNIGFLGTKVSQTQNKYLILKLDY